MDLGVKHKTIKVLELNRRKSLECKPRQRVLRHHTKRTLKKKLID